MANEREVPIFIFNGFLESGKTEFITYTLDQPYFQIKGKTLIILCEEGENEYDPALLKRSNACLELMEQEEDLRRRSSWSLRKR